MDSPSNIRLITRAARFALAVAAHADQLPFGIISQLPGYSVPGIWGRPRRLLFIKNRRASPVPVIHDCCEYLDATLLSMGAKQGCIPAFWAIQFLGACLCSAYAP